MDVVLSLDEPVLQTFYDSFPLQRVCEIFLEYLLAVTLTIDVEEECGVDKLLINHAKLFGDFAADIILKYNPSIIAPHAQERSLIVFGWQSRHELIVEA